MPLALALVLFEVAPVRLSASTGTRGGRGSDCVVVAACGGVGLIPDSGCCQRVLVMKQIRLILAHASECQWTDIYEISSHTRTLEVIIDAVFEALVVVERGAGIRESG